MTTRNGSYQSPFEDYLSFDELEQELAGEEESSRYQRAQQRGRPAPQRTQRGSRPAPQRARLLGQWWSKRPYQRTVGSESVRWAQHVLNSVLGLRLLENGIIGPATRAAIRDFQRREGMRTDGILGPPTVEALTRAAGGRQRAAQNGSKPAAKDSGEPTAKDSGEPAPQDDSQEQFIGDLSEQLADTESNDAIPSGARVIDLTAQADRSHRKGRRDEKSVYALVLHQMACCFNRRDPERNYLSAKAHFVILKDGRILQLHPIAALLWASHDFNKYSVAVEFAGNFPNARGVWWKGETYGRDRPTPAQIEAGRHLVRHLIRTMGLTHIFAHRQSSDMRENDPGPDIWHHVGQWAVNTHRLNDGGPGYKVGSGSPIPDQWRSWGRGSPTPELELETLDPGSPAHTRWLQNSLNQALGLRLPKDGRMSPAVRSALRSFQRQRGLPEHGELSDELEAELVGAGAAPHRHGEDEDEDYLGDLWGKVTGTASRLASGIGGLGGGGPSNSPAYVPTPSTASTGGAGATLRSQIAAVASAEWERWKRGATKEGDPAIRSVLTDYWKTGVGWLPSGSTWWSDVPWSAAFISWVVKKGGAGSSFKYSSAHAVYTAWAKQNKLSGSSSPFKAYRVTEVAPRVGDMVCKDRGSGATYDNIREGMFTHCDIVVEVQPGKLTTIGGNLSDSVRTSTVTIDAQGRITQRDYFAVIRMGD